MKIRYIGMFINTVETFVYLGFSLGDFKALWFDPEKSQKLFEGSKPDPAVPDPSQ